MKMDDQHADWHSVRPWQPTLSLSVREITSVSVTFILSSPYSTNDSANPDSSLVSLSLSSSDDDDSRDSASTTDIPSTQIVSDVLAKGLSVKVNGTPWQRVILKMDEDLDEAIIILYGLMPSRQYDVELGISPGQTSVRGQVTTDSEVHADTTLPDALPEESPMNSPETSSAPLSSSPTHQNGGTHVSNGHTPPNGPSLEDRRLQLTHTLNLLNAEQSSLAASLKSARKESQKADAALRSEIDTLKRASDRHTAGESRARKKVLALQEAVKQTLAAARDIDSLVQDIEGTLPVLENRKGEVEREWVKVKDEAEQTRERREAAERREKTRAETTQVELAGLVNRLERLNNKREKLEGESGVIIELEERLRKLEEERERIERDPYGYDGDGTVDSEDSGTRPGAGRTKEDSSPDSDKPHHANMSAHNAHMHPNLQRKRHHYPQHPRSSFPPRSLPLRHEPVHPAVRSANHHVPGVIHLQQQHHGPAPHKMHVRAPFRQQGSSSSSSGIVTPALSNVNPASSLSGRAPPFEPGRVRSHSHSHQQTPAQIQAQASMAARSDLNPDSTPFAPRAVVVQAAVSAVGSNVVGSGRVVPTQ